MDVGVPGGKVQVQVESRPRPEQRRGAEPGAADQPHRQRSKEAVQPAPAPSHAASGVAAPGEREHKAGADADRGHQARPVHAPNGKEVGPVAGVRGERPCGEDEEQGGGVDHERPGDRRPDGGPSPDDQRGIGGNGALDNGRGGVHALPPSSWLGTRGGREALSLHTPQSPRHSNIRPGMVNGPDIGCAAFVRPSPWELIPYRDQIARISAA